jgi:GTP-binding protein
MRAKSAEFVISAAEPSGFPRPTLPEIAFAGRSNVGKSSLINTLVGVPGLARTSRTPGRTRLLNWFRVTPPKGAPMHFVDLPGYGYARVPNEMRASWRPLIEAYLRDRQALRGLVLLVDARRGAEDEERDFLAWLREGGVPARVVVTKADKLPKNKRKPAALAVERDLALERPAILFSSLDGEGILPLWRAIAQLATDSPGDSRGDSPGPEPGA